MIFDEWTRDRRTHVICPKCDSDDICQERNELDSPCECLTCHWTGLVSELQPATQFADTLTFVDIRRYRLIDGHRVRIVDAHDRPLKHERIRLGI